MRLYVWDSLEQVITAAICVAICEGNTNLRGRVSTVDILIKEACFVKE
jgi:hypothetical protein